MSIVPNLDEMTDEQKLAVLESVQKSIAESKEIQKRKIGENVELVVQALKKIESDIRDRFDGVGTAIEKRVASIKDGRDGINGKDGRDGKDGRPGRDGLKGDRGIDGQPGRDGVDGVDGISVINAQIDFDGSLIISLSDGRELNVGEVVSQDVAEKIKVISTMSTNAAIAVKEEGTTITNGVKSLNFVGAGVTATTSGDDVTVTVAGGGGSGTVTSVALSGGTTGLTVTGSPITTTGTITLAGTLAAANGGTGQSSYAVGDLLYASTTTALSKLADVATGNALISGGVGVAPSWGKVGLTTHVSGTLPTANGGTNLTSFTSGGVVYASSTSALATGSALTFDGAILGVNGISVGRGAGAVDTNTAVGLGTLAVNTTGQRNTAIGYNALAAYTSTGATGNTAVGHSALALTTTGTSNTAVGDRALTANTTGTQSTAVGFLALATSTTGSSNSAFGRQSLTAATSGSTNTGVGQATLSSLNTGSFNTAVGRGAGSGIATTTIAATSLVNGTSYQIVTMGTTTAAQWIASGAVTGTVGETFTANSTPGVGTGTVATSANVSAQCQLNTVIGYNSGTSITTGSKNTILGSYTGSAAPISATGSNFVVLSDGDGNIVASTKTAQTFALQGGTLSSGTGIAFPATQSASTDANTLDDYEEGTITSSNLGLAYATPGTSSFTYSDRFGTYTKIGRVVYFTIDIRVSAFSKGTASGDISVVGLPFAQRNTSGYDNARCVVKLFNWTYTTSPVIGDVGSGLTSIGISRMVSNSASVTIDDPAGGSIIWVTGFYFV